MYYCKLSMVFFTSMKNAVVVTADRVEKLDVSVHGLPGDGLYLSNLDEEEISAVSLNGHSKARILAKSKLLVNPAYIAKEIGIAFTDEALRHNKDALMAVLQAYRSALFRLKFTINRHEDDVRASLIRHIKDRTMPSDFREAYCEAIDKSDFNIGAHSWVVTGRKAKDNEYIRTVHLDRVKYYYYLLNQELPVDSWEAGDPSVTVDILLGSLTSPGQGFIAEGGYTENHALDFFSGCNTGLKRNLYLPNEIISLREEGATFTLRNWWRGGMLKPQSPYHGCNTLSLADSIVMEMVYRSWRSQSLLGYWLAATERLIIHGIAEILSNDMSVIGYGSGKIAIATPRDPQLSDIQDNALLMLSEDCHVRIPIDRSWSPEKLCMTLPLLSDMQKIATSNAKALKDIDLAIDMHDADGVEEARMMARKSLEEKIA